VDIPEFPDLGTQVSQYVSSAIAGRMSVDEALRRGQELADDVAERYRAREARALPPPGRSQPAPGRGGPAAPLRPAAVSPGATTKEHAS
jgi:hypothetical protein